ncbi:FxSxx-COOH system tetratricopeptide repeat protein [Streptomyces sp. NPDC001815]|uniref:FxSxx-COOH system tetratricopeptide repeat protein n=1 Tax=Streptomyces sp. NPDC001815 TaxID=3154526 RepID=UPI00333216D0
MPTEAVLVVDSHVSMRVYDHVIRSLPAALGESFSEVQVVHLSGTDETTPSRVRTEPALGVARDGTRRVVLLITDGLAAGWHLGAVQPLLREWGLAWPVTVIDVLPPHLWFRTGLDVSHVQVKAPGQWAANESWEWRRRELPPELRGDEAEEGSWEGAVEDTREENLPVVVPVLSLVHHGARALSALLAESEPRWLDVPVVLAHRWKARPDFARAFPNAAEFPDSPGPSSAADRVSDFRAAASPTAFRLATRLAAAPLSLPIIRRLIASTPGTGPVHASELFLSSLVRTTGVRDDAPEAAVYEFLPGTREQLLALGRRSATIRTLREVREVLAASPASASLLPPPSASLRDPTIPTVTTRNAEFLRVELEALVAVSFLQRAGILRNALKWHDQRHVARLAGPPPAVSDVAPSPPSTEDEGAPRMSTTPQRSEEGVRTAQPRVWSLPPRNQNFTGRTELLNLLDQRLGEGTTTVLPEAIHGMGGVGKTQLAIEYAYRHQSEYDIVWWIPSERPGQIGQSLVELARRLGLTTSSEINVAGPAVREALREGHPYSRWMLIFDNADVPEQVRPYFPTGGAGTILVTSRNRRWGLMGGSLEVDVFAREESKELLRGSGPILADEEAEALARALGDLPLALVQAAAWRAETGMPASEYLRLFESKKNELLETAPPPDYQLPVAAAWNVSLDHLETRSPAALRLLQLCSYFAPDPISRKILSRRESDSPFPELDATLSDPMKLARAIREINRYSLARIDHRTNSIEMHRLVQHVLINRMNAQEQTRMRESAHSLMATADPQAPTDPTSWDRYAELYTHVMASDALRSDQSWTRDLVINIAKYLYHWGDHDVAVDFSESAWKTWLELFGEEDHQTLLMGQWLTWMYWTVGRYREASDLVEHVRRVYDRVADPDSESALDAIDTEAAVRRAEGRFQDGVDLGRVAYERAVRAFGEDDPVTLNIAHNLGVSLRLTGAFREALALDRKTWALKLRVFGRDEQRSLITENSIAIDVREIGDYIGARQLQDSALAASRELFGRDYPGTTDTVRELGIACRKAGDHARALEFALEAHEGFTRRYGETHPRSLASALSLAIALRQNGDLDAARARGLQACSGYRTVFHDRHPYTMSADVGLAVSERLLGRPEEARRLDETALDALVDTVGSLHPFTLVTAINLASDLAAVGEHQDAADRGRETLTRCVETFGPDHPTTLACAGNLAKDLVSVGLDDEGTALRRDTGERLERVLNTSPTGQGDVAPHPAAVEFRAGARANCDIDPLPL